MSSNNATMVEEELAGVYPGHEYLRVNNAAFMITSLGSVLYAIYNACMIIILLNMLIAMMSKSFDEIQCDRLEEWKFARANLWLVYIEHEGVLPAPLNLLPSREAITKLLQQMCSTFYQCKSEKFVRIKRRSFDEEDDGFDECKMQTGECIPFQKSPLNSTMDTILEGHSIGQRKHEDPETHLTRVKCNIMRRYLFQLQKNKEAENKTGDLAMLNMQRQQQQEIRVTPLNPVVLEKGNTTVTKSDLSTVKTSFAQHFEGTEVRNTSTPPTAASTAGDGGGGGGGGGNVLETNGDPAGVDKRPKESAFSRSLANSCKRGISSLLMPPSVRRKLEAVAEVQRRTHQYTPTSSQDAEDAVRFLLLQTTYRPPQNVSQLVPTGPGRGYDPGSFDSQFTARIERPLKDTHLRELYKVEQEMHDMSDALSSVSFTNSTMSEVDEFEVSPFDIIT